MAKDIKAIAAAAGAAAASGKAKKTKPKMSAMEFAIEHSHEIDEGDYGEHGADAWLKKFEDAGFDPTESRKAIRYVQVNKPHMQVKEKEIPESLKPQPSSLKENEPEEYYSPYNRRGIMKGKYINPRTLKPEQPVKMVDPDEMENQYKPKKSKR